MKKQPLISLNTQLGRWAEYVNTYTKLIKKQGYAHVSVQDQIRLITKFIGWLRRMHTEIGSLDDTIVYRFLRHRKNLGCTRHDDAAALDRFLHMLRGQGVAPPKKTIAAFSQTTTDRELRTVPVPRTRPSTRNGHLLRGHG
jgi:hypothetical protein